MMKSDHGICCPPERCRCGCCMEAQSGGYLLPRVVGKGKAELRGLRRTLQLDAMPCGAQPPYALLSVWAEGKAQWSCKPVADGGSVQLTIKIPLQCEVRDSCGRISWAQSRIEAEACLRMNCSPRIWREAQIMLQPCVRLCCAPVCSKDCCFDVLLDAEICCYAVHWECFGSAGAKQCCPQLPLYPQPCRPYPMC